MACAAAVLCLAIALPATVSATTAAAKTAAGAPWINIVAPQDGAVYRLDKPLAAKYKCERNGEPVATCVGTTPEGMAIDVSTVGEHDFTVTGTDAEGDTHTKTVHSTAVYTWNGFFNPVASKDQSVLNVVKAGAVVRIKFSLAGNRGQDVLSRAPSSDAVPCPKWSTHTAEAGAKPAGQDLAYSRTLQYYVYSWPTNAAWAGTCRDFRLRLADGTAAHVAIFQFTS